MNRTAAILLLCTTLCAAYLPRACAAEEDRKLAHEVNRAIAAGVKYLRERGPEFPAAFSENSYPGGVTCLAFYTLLVCGVAIDDPVMKKIEEEVVERVREVNHTYTISLALLGLLAADPERHASLINELIARLEAGQLRQMDRGAWGYVVPLGRTVAPSSGRSPHRVAHWDAPAGWWDHSNAQYAILALRSAADFGFNVDRAVFCRAAEHFLHYQNGDGGFGYSRSHRKSSYVSMTAGIAGSLVMCSDLHGEGKETRRQKKQIGRAVEKSARWVGARLDYPITDSPWPYYAMYALERLGHYSHTTQFGKVDWYREGARWLVDSQRSDGSWSVQLPPGVPVPEDLATWTSSSNLTDACFALLFLKRSSFVHTQISDEVLVLLKGIDPQTRLSDLDAIRGRILETGERAVPQLVKGLFLSAEPARLLADLCLRQLTGEDFGFQDATNDEEMRRAREEWVKYVLRRPGERER